MVEAMERYDSSQKRGAKYIRSASVRIRIIASNPTRKKEPTRAIYSALSMMVSCLFHNHCATSGA